MKLATLPSDNPDGELVIVSKDGSRFLRHDSATTLQQVLDNWQNALSDLAKQAAELDRGGGESTNGVRFAAPLPRAWQWLDGSAFNAHGELMQQAFRLDPIEHDKPLMYQGISDRFYGPTDDIPFASETHGIDFEGEFGVIVDEVPMGTSADEAMNHIRLLMLINDWSLRTFAAPEMKTGFGWINAKPACSAAPFAITPDELGNDWADGRVQLNLEIRWNDERFGYAHGGAMSVGFHELVAHAAATRTLCAGTIVGSGTVANENYREIGSSCISERRGIEIVDTGAPKTNFMSFGDSVYMEATSSDGNSAFGAIDQQICKHK